jgi:hypothetical protein
MNGACSVGTRQVKPAKKSENKCAIFSMLYEVKPIQSAAYSMKQPENKCAAVLLI